MQIQFFPLFVPHGLPIFEGNNTIRPVQRVGLYICDPVFLSDEDERNARGVKRLLKKATTPRQNAVKDMRTGQVIELGAGPGATQYIRKNA